MPPRVLVTADDYGLDPAVNHGIERLAAARQVDGVSVMAHPEADWSSLSSLLATGVSTGAHLVLVEERPLTSGRSIAPLLEGGRLPASYRALFARLAARPWLLRALVEEASAQLARLEASGVPLQFVNSHQHVHLFPPLWLALRPLLDRKGWRIRAVRGRVRRGPPRQVAVELAGALSWAMGPLREADAVRPIGVEAAGRLDGAAAHAAAARCRGERGAMELVVHPGEESPGLRRRYAHWRYRWALELLALERGEVRAAIDHAIQEDAA